MSLYRVLWGGLLAVALAGCPGEDNPPPAVDQKVSPADVRDGSSDGAKDAAGEAGDAANDASGEDSVDAALCGGVSCDDKLACTADVCASSGCINTVKSGHCLINKTCYKEGAANASGPCQKCDTTTSNTGWTDTDSLCPGSSLSCVSAKCTSGKCDTKIQSGFCVVSGVCVKDGAANPKNACRTCDTKKSVSSYQNAADGAACTDDNLTCTADTCKTGQCTHAITSGYCLIGGVCYLKGELNPLVACQACDPTKSTSAWSTQADGATCADDGLSCTTDGCKSGKCVHQVTSGSCVINSTCHKSGAQNPKSECQSCEPTTSTTSWSSKSNGTACTADSYSCTSDVCQSGTCAHTLKSGNCLIGGKCYSSGTKQPGKDCVSCVPSKSTSAWSVAVNGAACTADKYACTSDVCSGGTCTHAIKTSSCLIGGTCYITGAMHPSKDCSSCNPSYSKTSWSAQSDGSTCKADNYTCTRDTCKSGSCTHPLKPNFCFIGGKCYASGTKNPSNSCQYCNPKLSVGSWNVLTNGTTCKADTYACTQDVCSGGVCSHPIKPGYCKIGNLCYGSGAAHGTNACLRCNPGSSTTSWAVSPNGTPCASDGKSCTTDACSGGACMHTLQSSRCLIGGSCYTAGTQHPYLSCQYCNPTQSAYGWASRPNGSSCPSDGKFCTSDSCLGGTCAHNPVGGYCYIGGTCYNSGQHLSSTSCYYCNPSKSISGWSSYSYQGCCAGNTVKYCESGVFKQLDCSVNPTCGWSYLGSYYDCGTSGGSHPSYPKGC